MLWKQTSLSVTTSLDGICTRASSLGYFCCGVLLQGPGLLLQVVQDGGRKSPLSWHIVIQLAGL